MLAPFSSQVPVLDSSIKMEHAAVFILLGFNFPPAGNVANMKKQMLSLFPCLVHVFSL